MGGQARIRMMCLNQKLKAILKIGTYLNFQKADNASVTLGSCKVGQMQ